MKYIAAVLVFLAVLTTPLFAFEINTMTPEERQIFRQEVRAYLLEQPEVLMEAIAVLEQRQSTAAAVSDIELVAGNAQALFADGNSFVGGNPQGDVTMVEFLDYKCGFCRRAHPEVAELIKTDGNIRYIIKEFPILGQESTLASRFAISVLQNSDPETYFAASNALMTFRGNIDNSTLARLATDLNLDVEQIFVAMDSPAVTAVIAENKALAQQLKINGTPGFVFGNQMVRGYLPLDGMQQMVADVRLASR